MLTGGLESQRLEIQAENRADECARHPRYSVVDPGGNDIGIGLLATYYGELWETVLDRLDHKLDGHLFAIFHGGVEFNIYRNGVDDGLRRIPLRLVD